jgi:hypothetical protein
VRLLRYKGHLFYRHDAHFLVVARDPVGAAVALFETGDERFDWDEYRREARIAAHLLGTDEEAYYAEDGYTLRIGSLREAFVSAVSALPWEDLGAIDRAEPLVLLYEDGGCC